MSSRHQVHVDALRDRVLEGDGATPRELRAAAAGTGELPAELPAELRHYVDTVRRHAYKTTDADVAALARAGWSEDEIFEVTVATALGAALERLDAALKAIDGAGR